MRKTDLQPLAVDAVNRPGLLAQLAEANKTLAEVQRGLEQYLETKREAFPRFYFLSNDELLEILARSKEPRAVQPHLHKCFDAMRSLGFGEREGPPSAARHAVYSMSSAEGERVAFEDDPLPHTGTHAEVWLRQLEAAMRFSLHRR